MTHCRQIMLEELQRRNYAPTTISTYLHAVEQFARHFKCRPDRLNQSALSDRIKRICCTSGKCDR